MEKENRQVKIGVILLQILVMLYLFLHWNVLNWKIIAIGFVSIAITLIYILKILDKIHILIMESSKKVESDFNKISSQKTLERIKELYQTGDMNDVIDYIKKGLNEYEVDYRNESDLEILNIIIQKYNYVCKKHDIELTYKVDMNLKNVIKSLNLSGEELCTLLGNLLDNSIDVLNLSDRSDKKIYFSIVKNGQSLSIVVTNNGEMIPEKKRKKIFSYGYSTKEGARGAGLFIVYKLARKVGATIKLESSDEKTCFEIIFNNILLNS